MFLSWAYLRSRQSATVEVKCHEMKRERIKPLMVLLFAILLIYVITWVIGTLMLYSTGSGRLLLEVVFAVGNILLGVVIVGGLLVQTKFSTYIKDRIGSSHDLEMERYRTHSTDSKTPVVPGRRLPSIPTEEPFYATVAVDHGKVETEREEADSPHEMMQINMLYHLANQGGNHIQGTPDTDMSRHDVHASPSNTEWFNTLDDSRVTPSPHPPVMMPDSKDTEDDTSSEVLEILYEKARTGNQTEMTGNQASAATVSNGVSSLRPHSVEEEPWYKTGDDVISNRNADSQDLLPTPPPLYAEVENRQEPSNSTLQPRR